MTPTERIARALARYEVTHNDAGDEIEPVDPDAYVDRAWHQHEKVAEYVAAALSDAWRPIETAPRDGTWIWAAIREDDGDHTYFMLHWVKSRGSLKEGWYYLRYGYGWCRVDPDEGGEPVAWQPLPSAPIPPPSNPRIPEPLAEFDHAGDEQRDHHEHDHQDEG